MPKKKSADLKWTDNTRSQTAKKQAEAARIDAKRRAQEEAESEFWTDSDKKSIAKAKRLEQKQQKAAEAARKKQEKKELEEKEKQEIDKIKPTIFKQKKTRAQIAKTKIVVDNIRAEEEKKMDVSVTELPIPENVNIILAQERANPDLLDASSVIDGIKVLNMIDGNVVDDIRDLHPEKRVKAAFLAYCDKRLPEMKQELPSLKLSQLKHHLRKEFAKSPENPLNR